MPDTKSKSNLSRPPIVTILGHVDHGKTTLLDALRKTKIADREAGGITQSIGASVVTTKDGADITFIDTPGHSVFNNMRKRGAKLADIVILVVAANDGVKPQTKEAIRYIKETKVPYIVAATKVDLPNASIDKTKADLLENEVLLEGLGGDVPFVSVSGTKGTGLVELLDIIKLVAEMSELKGDPSGEFEGQVIETIKGKQGALVSVVVKQGILKVKDEIKAGDIQGRVRGLFDENGEKLHEVLPGYPAQVLGFSDLPAVGAVVVSSKETKPSKNKSVQSVRNAHEDAVFSIVVKAGSIGSLEALQTHVSKDVAVISSGVGAVTESDVFIAKAAEAKIIAFESKITGSVKNLARTEGVDIESFAVIYKLFEYLDELIKEGEMKIGGKAVVQAIFPFNKQKVAGCKMMDGEIKRSDRIQIVRNEKSIGDTKISSMKKEKKEITLVKSGEEFGVMFSPFLDFQVGDVILSVS